jgi:hypothetical protein
MKAAAPGVGGTITLGTLYIGFVSSFFTHCSKESAKEEARVALLARK